MLAPLQEAGRQKQAKPLTPDFPKSLRAVLSTAPRKGPQYQPAAAREGPPMI